MKRTQKQKREAARRPRKEYFIYYSADGSPQPIKIRHYSESMQRAWNAYCKNLEGVPTRADYETFINKK